MPNKALEALKIPEHLSKRKKLTEAQRAAICVHHKAGISQTVLAKHFGVSRGTIRFITNPAAYEIAKQQRRDRYAEHYCDGRYYDKATHTKDVADLRRRKKIAMEET